MQQNTQFFSARENLKLLGLTRVPRSPNLSLISSRRVDKVLATVREEVFLAVLLRAAPVPRPAAPADLPRVDVHPVLALLREGHGQRDDVPADLLRDVLAQLLLLHPVLVEGGHEVRQGPGHAEGDVELLAGEDEGVRVGLGHEAEEPVGLGRAPLPGGAVGERDHDGVEVLAADLELADRLELHRLAGEVLLRRDRVGEDVEEERAGAGRVHAERHEVVHDGLKEKRGCMSLRLLFLARLINYLHDEALEADALVVVLVVAVELEVVVEDQARLHVRRHLQPYR